MSELLLVLSAGVGAPVDPLGPTLWGLEPYQVVSIAMLVLILVMVWKKVPGMITGGLDRKIAAIREQLDEAKALRGEAEALRNEYADKIANAEKDAEAMLDSARREADAVLAKAEADSSTMVERRKLMAENKIAAAEREALDDVRNRAAMAATAAAKDLIAAKHTNAADARLADEIISSL